MWRSGGSPPRCPGCGLTPGRLGKAGLPSSREEWRNPAHSLSLPVPSEAFRTRDQHNPEAKDPNSEAELRRAVELALLAVWECVRHLFSNPSPRVQSGPSEQPVGHYPSPHNADDLRLLPGVKQLDRGDCAVGSHGPAWSGAGVAAASAALSVWVCRAEVRSPPEDFNEY